MGNPLTDATEGAKAAVQAAAADHDEITVACFLDQRINRCARVDQYLRMEFANPVHVDGLAPQRGDDGELRAVAAGQVRGDRCTVKALR